MKVGLDRDALLMGIDGHIVASFHRASNVTARFLVDLGELNRVEHRVGGDLPLRTWLQNAIAMLGPRHETSTVVDVLDQLDAAIKKTEFCQRLHTHDFNA